MTNELISGKKQIVICCDGTNNTLTAHVHDTNVLKMFQHLASQQRAEQLLYYDPGVGAPDALPTMTPLDWLRNKMDRLWGLASGRGIYENIGQAYLFLMKHYQPGDQIYVFGFSRGAFTARCVTGMVHLFGILNAQHESMLPTLLRVYFSNTKTSRFFGVATLCKRMLGFQSPRQLQERQSVADQIRYNFCDTQRQQAAIHFVGVWDTVASVGLPGMGPKISSTGSILNKRIRHVRHALSLDEHRMAYGARLYLQNNFGDETTAQSMLQLWFPGNHNDVGGGYRQRQNTKASETFQSETLLSDYSWDWMHTQAVTCGLFSQPLQLDFNRKVFAHDETYSMPWWTLVGLTQRNTTQHSAIDDKQGVAVPLRVSAGPRTALSSFNQDSLWKKDRDGVPLILAALGVFVFILLFNLLIHHTSVTVEGLLDAAKTCLSAFAIWEQDQLYAAWHPNHLLDYAHRISPFWAIWLAQTGVLVSVAFIFARWLSKSFAYRLGFTLPGQRDYLSRWTGNALMLWIVIAFTNQVLISVAWKFSLLWPCYPVSLLSALKWCALIWVLISCLAMRLISKPSTAS